MNEDNETTATNGDSRVPTCDGFGLRWIDFTAQVRSLTWWRRWLGLHCTGCGRADCRGCCGCQNPAACTAPRVADR